MKDDYEQIDIIVHIRDNKTLEVVSYESSMTELFIWEDGNYSCDCNRYIFFERAKSNDTMDEEFICSYGKYSVNIYSTNNECLYTEFEEVKNNEN